MIKRRWRIYEARLGGLMPDGSPWSLVIRYSAPLVETVSVPTFPIHPRVLERYREQRAELERLLTPEALARLDAVDPSGR